MLKLIKILDSKGFTLIEVLISITILGFMSFGIYNFTETIVNTSSTVIPEDKDFLKIETAMARFENDFSQIYTPLYFDVLMNPSQMRPEEGEVYNQLIDIYQRNQRFSQITYEGHPVPIYEAPEKSEFIFFTTSNRRKVVNSKQSRFAWVRYSLAPDTRSSEDLAVGQTNPDGQDTPKAKMALVRQIYNTDVFNPENVPWDDIKTQVLLRGVDSLKFEFWNPETLKWTDNLTTIKLGSHRIYATRLSLVFFDLNDNERYTERIFRPLYPEFQPEDIYQFLKRKPQPNSARGGIGSPNSQPPEQEGDE